MSSQALLRELMLDIQADRQDYTTLQDLLEQQFAAFLRQDAGTLGQLADAINTLLDVLQGRKQKRQQLARSLQPAMNGRSLNELFRHLPEPLASRFAAPWQALCQQAAVCKQLNERNGMLLQNQHELYQRILFGESDVYVAS